LSRRTAVEDISGAAKDLNMHVVVRHYKDSAKLIDELVDRRTDVEELIRGVDGFVAYYLVRTADSGARISVFETESATTESTKRAAAYIKENLDGVATGPPEVIDGLTVIDFK
jgi:heme-degrading monooxygenase HmoA